MDVCTWTVSSISKIMLQLNNRILAFSWPFECAPRHLRQFFFRWILKTLQNCPFSIQFSINPDQIPVKHQYGHHNFVVSQFVSYFILFRISFVRSLTEKVIKLDRTSCDISIRCYIFVKPLRWAKMGPFTDAKMRTTKNVRCAYLFRFAQNGI